MCATSQRRRHTRWRMLFLLICILGYIRHSESAPPIPGRNIESRVAPGVPSSGSTVARKLEEVGLPSELAWQAWLLFDPHSGTHSDLDSSSLLRRIIPKSVFIAPPRATCPDGFQLNPGGGCTKKNVEIDHEAQTDFIVQRLNAMFRKQAVKLPAINGPSQKLSSGPLQLNIPLTSSFDTHSTRVKHDQSIEQEENKFQPDLMSPISFPIPFPQRSPAETNKRKVEEIKLALKKDEDSLDDKDVELSVRNHSSSSKNKNDGSPMNLVIAIDENAGSSESSKEDSDHDDIDSLELPSDSSEHFTDKRKQDKMATENYNKYEVKNDTNSEEDEEEEELKSSNKNGTTSSRDSSREHEEDFGEVISEQRNSGTEPIVTELNWSDESTTSFPDSTELDQEQTEESTELLITVTTPRDVEHSIERKDSEEADKLKNETDLEEVETKFSVVNNSHNRNSISQKRLDRNIENQDELDEETTTSLSESTRTDQTEQATDISTTPLPGTMNFLFNRYSQEEVTTENYPSSDPDFEEDEGADSSVESDLDSSDEQKDEQSGNQESKDESYSQPQVGMRVLEFTENSNNTNLSGIVDYKT